MLIRHALPADAHAFAALAERLWRGTYTDLIPAPDLEAHLEEAFGPAQQAAELADSAWRTLLLEGGGELLGYAQLRTHGPVPGTPSMAFTKPLEIARFYLAPATHGTGAARELMEAVLAEAADAGHDGAWLQVWERNARARRFYAKLGFTPVGTTDFRVGSRVYHDLVLVHGLELPFD
jgi:GNAT superfamily N-acetyltransferase